MKIRFTKGVWMMLVASMAFGLMNVSVKMIQGLPVAEIVLFRAFIQILIGYAFIVNMGISPLGKNKLLLLQRGVFGSLGLLCYFYTLQQMPLGNAVILYYIAPILTTVLAIWFANEKVQHIQWGFFALTFLGVIIVNSTGHHQIEFWDLMAGIGGAVFSALAYNTIKKLKGIEDPNVVVLYFPMVTVPIALMYFIYKPQTWVMPGGMQWFWLVLTGITTQVGQFFMTRAYQEDTASRVSAVSYAGLIWGAGFGITLFGETYSWLQYLGMAMVLAGVILNVNAYRIKLWG